MKKDLRKLQIQRDELSELTGMVNGRPASLFKELWDAVCANFFVALCIAALISLFLGGAEMSLEALSWVSLFGLAIFFFLCICAYFVIAGESRKVVGLCKLIESVSDYNEIIAQLDVLEIVNNEIQF